MRCDIPYPVIDIEKTGNNIQRLREKRGLSVAEVQHFLGLSDPQAIYQWQRGSTLPSVDHLCALSKLLRVTIDEILILQKSGSSGHATPPTGTCNTVSEFLRRYVLVPPKAENLPGTHSQRFSTYNKSGPASKLKAGPHSQLG